MSAAVLMVVGTASSVGKSVLVTALCRIFAQDGIRVAPFKAQNMSNNADVTRDGLEIGRAQAEQAAAAGLEPAVDMNPVLLKPQGDRTSQLVLNGQPAGLLRSRDFIDRKRDLWPDVERALERLRDRYDLVIAEGAGSAAEPNLRSGDIVNMRVAQHARAATLLVGDIDRGGVFAHLLGTVDLMPPEDRALIQGFIINRFRGDPSLLAPAIEELERRTGIGVLGVVPWIDDLRVAQEDAVALERPEPTQANEAGRHEVDVAVVHLPRIANFDDFDPLAREPSVRLRYVSRAADLGEPDLLIIPGTKATIADLEVLRHSGLAEAIVERARAGTAILGVCGGFQILGEHIVDPDGVEAWAGASVRGLGLLPVTTQFEGEKQTRRARGTARASAGPWTGAAGVTVEGYEIHMGRTTPTEGRSVRPFLELDAHEDGAVSEDGRVAGTYLHGLFHNDELRGALLKGLGATGRMYRYDRDAEFDRLAHHVRAHLDLDAVRRMLALPSEGAR